MKEVLCDYWREMFAEYQVHRGPGVLSFAIPGFPEPLLSANFLLEEEYHVGHLAHLISFKQRPPSYEVVLKPHLCLYPGLQMLNTYQELELRWEPLSEAIARNSFWHHQQLHNAEAYPLMKRLLPFLANKGNHWHYFFPAAEGAMMASCVVGVTATANLLFNGSVAREYRRKKVLYGFTQAVRLQLEGSCFFWTLHPWLKLGADNLNFEVLNKV